ncbi:hypothetical protein LOK49_LG03G01394 [Camellia lanceoleosa]|uniref:Uncharacterized protein n=1 Tax=Camellia lanceoleosa TaxID=1840588 RepID=A0ACC0I731_9ERIC|nr:hypothetical protein LOK49_LG03G01394 [Camellia lanceoleosa]
MIEIALARAAAVLRQTVGVLSNSVFKEGSRLSRLRKDIVWIECEMRHVQAYLEDAEAKQGRSRGVANLVIDIRDLACDVEDIIQKYFPQIALHRRKGFWVVSRVPLASSATGMMLVTLLWRLKGSKEDLRISIVPGKLMASMNRVVVVEEMSCGSTGSVSGNHLSSMYSLSLGLVFA